MALTVAAAAAMAPIGAASTAAAAALRVPVPRAISRSKRAAMAPPERPLTAAGLMCRRGGAALARRAHILSTTMATGRLGRRRA